MDRQELYQAVLHDIRHRAPWEQRLATFYKMRHDGLRRRNKPWPGAADLHYPLADTIIGKLKPYYFEQIFATETLATFVCDDPGYVLQATDAARWFDYRLKQESNLETEILTVIDFMLQAGRSTCKIVWDPAVKALRFDAAYPQNIIVPQHTLTLDSADRITQVLPMSVSAYRANPNYKQNETFIRVIAGRKMPDENDSGGYVQAKEVREGITVPSREDEIIVWESYCRESDGKWYIETFSPNAPGTPIRPRMAVPYKHGKPPFVDFYYEVKDKGWYSPRGIPELVASHEASLSKMWNEKLDCMTLYNRPLFRTSQQIPNTLNLQFQPGQVLPYDIAPVQHSPPPMSFDQEMQSTRMVAEQRVAMPDYGMGQLLNQNTRRTAREVNEISEVMGNAVDLRMRIFRHSLGRLYRQAWELLKEFRGADLDYYFNGSSRTVQADVLKKGYSITPTGSADGVSRVFLFNKAVSRFQMFNNDPFINQGELRKSILETDDVSLVRRLWTDPNIEAATQAEDQAYEIGILKEGFPALVKPTDDHAVHIQTAAQYLHSRAQLGEQFNPVASQRITEHIGQHLQELQKVNPKLAKQLLQQLQQSVQPQPAQPMAQP